MDENEDDDDSEFFEPGFNTKMVDEEKKQSEIDRLM